MKLVLLTLLIGCTPAEEVPRLVEVADPAPDAKRWVWTDREMGWRLWSQDLFEEAQREDRPILVYLAAPGYEGLFPTPTPGLRRLVADGFISTRVDPFKRPDIANYYDTGGWPALAIALPNGQTFARAVDIPPPNIESYLRRLRLSYDEQRAVLIDKARRAEQVQDARMPFDVVAVYRACAVAFDSLHGGFGGPTKFLEASVLRFLLTYGETKAEERAVQMALTSLDAVLDSPLSEGGGFLAYSYTPNWRVPAGEMDGLDQAAMLHLLLEADRPRYTVAARALLDFVEREFFDTTEGVFWGRRVALPPYEDQTAGRKRGWWTDPTLYADRQAALIRACLAAATVLEDVRAARLAIRAGDTLIERCIDGRGGVRHVCGVGDESISGLLVDQALVALALSDLLEWSGEARFGIAAKRVVRFMEQELGGRTAFYNRAAGPLPRFFAHCDDDRPAGNALALEFYGGQGDAVQSARLMEGLHLATEPDRAYSSWARGVLRYGAMAKTSL